MAPPDTSGYAAWQDLLEAAARCPNATAWPYDQALRDRLGVAFYRVMMADPEHRVHVEARTYGGPAADFTGLCPPFHTRSAAHETLVLLVSAFRGAPDGTPVEDPTVLLEVGRSTDSWSARESVLARAVALLADRDPDDPRLPKAYLSLADAYGTLGDAERAKTMRGAAVEFHRRAVAAAPHRHAHALTETLYRVSELAARHGQAEEAHTTATEALDRIRQLHEGMTDQRLAIAPFLHERIQLTCRAAHAMRDRPTEASALFREALGLYRRRLAVIGYVEHWIMDELRVCLDAAGSLLLPEGAPLGTLVIHDIGGVLFVEDEAERDRREAYINRVEGARTYGEARAAGAPVDDFTLYEDYYVDLYVAAHDDMDPDELLSLDVQERRRLVSPSDEVPFDLEQHPMYEEGEWWPLPANNGSWRGQNFPSEPIDNGGRVSTVEGWPPEDGDAITLYLLSNGWAVRRQYSAEQLRRADSWPARRHVPA